MKLSYCRLFVSKERTRQDGVEVIKLRRTNFAKLLAFRPTVAISGSVDAARCRLQIGSGIHCHSSASLIAPGHTFGVAAHA